MLGRGALACLDLARAIKQQAAGTAPVLMAWPQVVDELVDFFARSDQPCPRYVGNRTKQWLSYLRRHYSGAELLFQRIKRLRTVAEILAAIDLHRNEDLRIEMAG